MVSWGVLLIVLGAGSLILPSIGWNFTLMELLDDFQPYAGIVVALVGAVLLFVGMNRPTESVAVSRAPEDPPARP